KVIHGSTDYVIDKNTLEEEYTAVPIGPYHPALHEPEYFEVYVNGETIVDARYKGFFIHRGIEKIAESRLTYDQVPFIAERICGICGFTHSTAYCLAVENAAGIDVPERASYIRSILLEIERIHSHLLWMGVAFHLLGYDTGFMIMWRIRERIMDLAEELTGNRKTYGANIVGGIRKRFDISEEKIPHIKRLLNSVKEEYLKYIDKIVSMTEIRKRTREVGILSHEDAKKYSVLGPHARASGIDTDVRKYRPYAAYGEVDFKVPVSDEGDVYARIIVRHEEVLESINIIIQLLDNLPKTPLRAEFNYIPEKRTAIGCTEAPRGEDLHFVITGSENKIYRWRPRAPSYNNLASVPLMLRGEKLADAPIIIASIDPCFSCTDHVVVIDIKTGRRRKLVSR
ncbi:MAG: nickel-dependent hydrogenase large subunit, partial [Staphylothermus sp.]|nr:nickel-dependent hydrogenase large subunit [Staphylothermus sp.]